MFTGIVENRARIVSVADAGGFRRISIAIPWTDVREGESIAVNGCCLTVAELAPGAARFDVIAETLGKTNLSLLENADEVNVERAMKVGDRIDGHFVQGHVDGLAALRRVENLPGETRLTLEAPAGLAKYVVPKGSVTLDGVSLTVAECGGMEFQVALIPTTLARTTLGTKTPGYSFNFEADVLSKTVISWLERQQPRREDRVVS